MKLRSSSALVAIVAAALLSGVRRHMAAVDAQSASCRDGKRITPLSTRYTERHGADGVHCEASVDEHQAAERGYWRSSLRVSKVATFASTASFVFAGFALWFSYDATREATRQADIAQKALAASTRPWMQAKEFSIERAAVSEGRAVFSTKLVLKNVGSTPALVVYVRPTLLTADMDPYPRRLVRGACSRAKEIHEPVFNTVVFPGEERTITAADLHFSVALGEVRRAREAQAAAQSLTSGNRSTSSPNTPLEASFILIGCITYRAAGVDKPFGTSFGLEAWWNPTQEPGYQRVFSLDKQGVFPIEQVIQLPLKYGLTAD